MIHLHDHQTASFTMLDISRLRLPQPEFAFLSACETALGGVKVPDEAMHLAGALRMAGYQHVVATLWPVSDNQTVALTDGFYRRLTANGSTVADTAVALHHATLDLRDRYPDHPILWAAYSHTGP